MDTLPVQCGSGITMVHRGSTTPFNWTIVLIPEYQESMPHTGIITGQRPPFRSLVEDLERGQWVVKCSCVSPNCTAQTAAFAHLS